MSALLNGIYSGETTVAELLRHGDVGLGTFNELDGEMVVLDGICYRMRVDGSVSEVALETRTPFATVTRFVPENQFTIAGTTDREELEALIDRELDALNSVHAIQLAGTFRQVRTRTVSRQPKPYPPFVEATANDPVISHENVTGTMIGFRSPNFVQGITVAGYHLHFVDDARRRGGHVLDFAFEQGLVAVSTGLSMFVDLPQHAAFQNTDLCERDIHSEILKTEGIGVG
jgi:acetolactate decarboxylase